MHVGATATVDEVVTAADTAVALGSGDVPVLATPRLLAWAERATCAAVADDLSAGQTTVGARVSLQHSLPTPVGGRVRISAEVEHVHGRQVRLSFIAADGDGRVIGSGDVTRVLVERARFVSGATSG